ncbi:peptide-methionine (R)-S-oxide reductase [Flavobacterium sp. 7E]|uniref:peptide-methionine (R)-S-oxide reductase MsrB n=1 Tax=unclassified Flavobacterium TaxID=196869 RepID=UPI00157036FC|nr:MULTISPECIES: peptide-methionine (R)-S-oxide reductase MsrB [unclassified Flavobacterium]MBE0391529.1 Peptide methionine sulfoxide reductase MsrB [Flavobacterium sp. PL002]NRS90531.1 peptide-methionine (R)-S-oxide reductase [Flavobacterium sp. 7E]
MKRYQQILLLPVIAFGFIACMQANKSNKENTDTATTMQQQPVLSLTDTSLKKVAKTDAEWKKVLTPNQYYVLREKGTERPYQNEFNDNHKKGNYFCAACKLPLFSSKAKFNSGTGWPSFYDVINQNRVKEVVDKSLGMVRGEIVCARCEGHLGHLFDDGPSPTGLRYCMNSASLLFQEAK